MTAPWLFALATAVWFGWMAHFAGRNWLSWALGGALLGLVATTLVLGVSGAQFIPMSHDAAEMHRIKSLAACAFVVLLFGWIFSSGLHQHPQKLWQLLRGTPSTGKPYVIRDIG